MTTYVAINGFGRIGRLVLRAAFESRREDIKIVAINGLGTLSVNAHLLRYDSVHGPFPGSVVERGKDSLDLGQGPISVTTEREPDRLPWDRLGIDVVLECTGRFACRDSALRHLTAGARRVLISAPAQDADQTIVFGVNHHQLKPEHQIVSCASCTTNCLAPIAYVLHQAVGIEHGFMTTVHAYTGDQPNVDSLHGDMRRARAAGLSMIPTSTGAARAVGLVLPELAGKLDGTAIRVPTPNVSLVDFVFTALRSTAHDDINHAIVKASEESLAGIVGVNQQPLVSSDFNHDTRSSIFDATQTQIIEGKLIRILSWYDNEWGFSHRMCDVAAAMGQLG